MEHFKDKLRNIKAFAFDVDGVFSGNVILHPSGDLMRSMNIKDGYAVQLAVKKGFPVAIITGGNSPSVRSRFEALGVTDIYMKSQHKLDDFEEFLLRYELNPSQVLYMGDDIPDIEIMKIVGIPTCPSDAAEEVKQIATYISPKGAGEGCIRDVIEQVLKINSAWTDAGLMSK